MNQADTAWMLMSTALVLLMTPALAFFYGGLVRSKNVLNTMMMSFVSLGVVGVLWALVGYSLAFSGSGAWLGDLSFAMLNGVGLEAKGTIPHALFMGFQGTFAIITAALISGAIVERMKFSAYLLFISLWTLFVYSPVCHWVWASDGWLFTWGALDFAGGTVVHMNACRTTSRSPCSDQACCGSAGSASTRARRSAPRRPPRSPSSPRCLRRPRP
jgi:Amt family ammonium transporter